MNTPLYIAALAFLILAVSAWAFILTIKAVIEHREKKQLPPPPKVTMAIQRPDFYTMLGNNFTTREVQNLYMRGGYNKFRASENARQLCVRWKDAGFTERLGRGHYRKIKQPQQERPKGNTYYTQTPFHFEQNDTTNTEQ